MIATATPRPTEGELRSLLSEAGVDVTASVWPDPGFVVAAGQTVAPCLLDGVLLVDSIPVYSAAWL